MRRRRYFFAANSCYFALVLPFAYVVGVSFHALRVRRCYTVDLRCEDSVDDVTSYLTVLLYFITSFEVG